MIGPVRRSESWLERNLHDGAQQRLIALSLELGLLGSKLRDDPEASTRIQGARAEIATSLEELRDVARGLHPAVLTGHGLAVAVESLAATSAVPVELKIDCGPARRARRGGRLLRRLGEPHQCRQTRPCSIGVGGGRAAQPPPRGRGDRRRNRRSGHGAGSGLRGLADRVEALGERLRIWTPRGGGTRVRAELPCG